MSERTNRYALVAAALILLAIVPGLYATGMVQITVINQLGRFLCLAIVALGLDLVWGYSGILSLCQAMFFCIGGYCMGMHLALHGPLDGDGIPRCLYVVTSQVSGFSLPWFWEPLRTFPMAMVLGVAIPGAIAFLFGYLSFRSRVRGVYLSIITQALTVIAVLLFRRNELHLCGTNGLTNFETLLGFDLRENSTKLGLYWVSAVALVAAYLACRHLVRSRAGRLLVAIRDNESRLRFSGYHPVHFKTFVFTLGAILAALGGMLYTPQNGIITPAKMEPYESIYMVIWVAVGGRGTLAGAVIGALAVNGLASLLTSVAPITWPFLVAGSAIGVVLFTPDGLLGLWQRLSQRFWAKRTDPDQRDPTAGEPDPSADQAASVSSAGPTP
jgi:urea transport system permease protein